MKRLWILFFSVLGIYLWQIPPTLAPYRDAGEMVTGAFLLGVCHSPGYPLYVLLSRAFLEVWNLGNAAYRMNLLSALAGAWAVCALWRLLKRQCGEFSAWWAALALAASPAFGEVSSVSEMYSLHIAFAAGLLFLLWRYQETGEPRLLCLFSFLFGLGLGNRMDLVLMGPTALFLIFSRRPLSLRTVLCSIFFFFLGFSVYLYLPLRSLRDPWLDWNHPAAWKGFVGSLTRKTHGRTLDLLSKNYPMGSMFPVQMEHYLKHLWREYGPLVFLFAFLGFWKGRSVSRSVRFGLLVGFLISGPLFLFLANMPPNPHALAILKPHYLLPDLFLLIAFGWGLHAWEKNKRIWSMLLSAQIAFLLCQNRPDCLRRYNTMAHDYARNVLRTLPPSFLLEVREDVQLFSLWYFQQVLGKRRDGTILAQGLSGSPWYQRMVRRSALDIWLGPLKEAEDWRSFEEENEARGWKVFATGDAEIPASLKADPAGLLRSFSGFQDDAWNFYIMRRPHRYSDFADFFSSDLMEEYAKGHLRQGGLSHVLHARWQHPALAEPSLWLGFIFFQKGDWVSARAHYAQSVGFYEEMLGQAKLYRALPDVELSIRRALSEAYLNLGVVEEKMEDRISAQRHYLQSLSYFPGSAQTHYNLAVLYWGRDWNKTVEHLQSALRIDPGHAAARYLPQALARLRAGSQR